VAGHEAIKKITASQHVLYLKRYTCQEGKTHYHHKPESPEIRGASKEKHKKEKKHPVWKDRINRLPPGNYAL
jgi:hypothetical protein